MNVLGRVHSSTLRARNTTRAMPPQQDQPTGGGLAAVFVKQLLSRNQRVFDNELPADRW